MNITLIIPEERGKGLAENVPLEESRANQELTGVCLGFKSSENLTGSLETADRDFSFLSVLHVLNVSPL